MEAKRLDSIGHTHGDAYGDPHGDASGIQQRITRALDGVLNALVRVLLRQGIDYSTFTQMAKRAYVRVATEEFGLRDRPTSKSRVALLTGVNRREVARIQREAEVQPPQGAFSPAFRMVALWIREPAYADADGRPATIPVLGDAPSLDDLRARACPDVPITAIVRELMRSGVVSDPDGDDSRPTRLRLNATGYVPREDTAAKVEILGTDVAALLDTIGWNITRSDAPRFQRKVSFSNLNDQGVARLHALAEEAGQALLERLDTELAQHTTDEGGRFAGLGLYEFVDDTHGLRAARRNPPPLQDEEPS